MEEQRKQEIGYIVYDPISYPETFLLQEIEILHKLGHMVTVFSGYSNLKPKGYRLVKGYPTKWLSFTFWVQAPLAVFSLVFRALKPAWRLYRYEKETGASFFKALKRVYLTAHILPYNLDWVVLCYGNLILERKCLGKAMGAKMAVCFRGYDIGILAKVRKDDFGLSLNYADKIFSRSRALHENGLQAGLNPDIPWQEIPSGVDIGKVDFIPKPFEPGEQLEVLSIGRLHWKKGHEFTLMALHVLEKKGIDFRFTIIGDGIEKEKLSYLGEVLQIGHRIHFKGWVEHDQVFEFMHKSHILVHSSLNEGCCNTLLEGQAAGVFCIASAIPGNNIEDNETGLVYPVCDHHALACAIEGYLAMSPENRGKILMSGRNKVGTYYSKLVLEENLKSFFA
jgi:colanic acid/amylovoran biosynthesis glycosyltransferase